MQPTPITLAVDENDQVIRLDTRSPFGAATLSSYPLDYTGWRQALQSSRYVFIDAASSPKPPNPGRDVPGVRIGHNYSLIGTSAVDGAILSKPQQDDKSYPLIFVWDGTYNGATPPGITAGGIYNMHVDGRWTQPDSGTDDRHGNINVVGAQDFTISNFHSERSAHYGLALQNGRRRRMRLRDLYLHDCVADGVDVKNNGSISRDSSLIGLWLERFGNGAGDGGKFPYAGLDLMEENWAVSQVWIRDFATTGFVDAAIRLKQGESSDSRGIGGYRAQISQVHVNAPDNPNRNLFGVDCRHRQLILSDAHFVGNFSSHLYLRDRESIITGIHTEGGQTSVNIVDYDNGTSSDGHLLMGIRSRGAARGLDIQTSNNMVIGYQGIGTDNHVRVNGDRNFIIGRADGGSNLVEHEGGSQNLVIMWQGGTLRYIYDGSDVLRVGSTVTSAQEIGRFSDERLKEGFRDFSDAEIEASCKLAKIIGMYRMKNCSEISCGVTAQRVVEVMAECGLDASNYGFVQYDTAEDLYTVRYSEFNAFIMRGMDARISKLESQV